jgi:hypothetical protein
MLKILADNLIKSDLIVFFESMGTCGLNEEQRNNSQRYGEALCGLNNLSLV